MGAAFLAVPFGAAAAIGDDVRGIPTLKLFSADGALLAADARGALELDPAGAHAPWAGAAWAAARPALEAARSAAAAAARAEAAAAALAAPPHEHALDAADGHHACDVCRGRARGAHFACPERECGYEECPACFAKRGGDAAAAEARRAARAAARLAAALAAPPHAHALARFRRRAQCDVCRAAATGAFFSCFECDVDECPACFAARGGDEAAADAARAAFVAAAPRHEHALAAARGAFREGDDEPCSVCRERVVGAAFVCPDATSGGGGEGYTCGRHVECAGCFAARGGDAPAAAALAGAKAAARRADAPAHAHALAAFGLERRACDVCARGRWAAELPATFYTCRACSYDECAECWAARGGTPDAAAAALAAHIAAAPPHEHALRLSKAAARCFVCLARGPVLCCTDADDDEDAECAEYAECLRCFTARGGDAAAAAARAAEHAAAVAALRAAARPHACALTQSAGRPGMACDVCRATGCEQFMSCRACNYDECEACHTAIKEQAA